MPKAKKKPAEPPHDHPPDGTVAEPNPKTLALAKARVTPKNLQKYIAKTLATCAPDVVLKLMDGLLRHSGNDKDFARLTAEIYGMTASGKGVSIINQNFNNAQSGSGMTRSMDDLVRRITEQRQAPVIEMVPVQDAE